jgi:hypothetical protein
MSCRVRLDYLLDTFLGPIAKSVECEVVIIPITVNPYDLDDVPVADGGPWSLP